MNYLKKIKELICPIKPSKPPLNLSLEQIEKYAKKEGYRLVRLTTDKTKKIKASKNANKIKIDTAKEKIENAINILKMYGQKNKITMNTIAGEAKVSRNTVIKYVSEKQLEILNENKQ